VEIQALTRRPGLCRRRPAESVHCQQLPPRHRHNPDIGI